MLIRPRLLTLLAVTAGGLASGQSSPTLSVNAGATLHAINPNIYGIVSYGLDTSFAQEIKVPNIRWGGDGTTRYNWEVDSSNAGFDWYFVGGNGQANPVPGASADTMVRTYAPAGALITIPIIPYVNSTAATTCSFPVSVYGAQQSTNPYVHPNGDSCGNSLTPSGAQLADTNILMNHIPNTVSLQQGWVQHLVSTFGTAAKGGVPFYQLDNEPTGWANTHRDVQPTTPSYNTILSLGQQYAAVIKQQDPTASVLGPSDFTLGGWIGTPAQQNNLFAGQYYLQQWAAHDKTLGSRTLDYFDEHYYPQFSNATTQLASTRTFWDPTYNGGTWVEQYFFYGPMQLIPRFQGWISQYYPGTKLAFSEYSIDSGNKLITDALAEADVLGIFGWQGVDFANMWSPPASTDPIAYAFRLYRNYDGQGGEFGDQSLQASSSSPGVLSIYAAKRSVDGALTLVVINKSTSAIQTPVTVANFNSSGYAQAYSYSGANLKQIVSAGSVAISAGSLTYDFPAYSATVFALAPSTVSPTAEVSLASVANCPGIYTDGTAFSTGGLDRGGYAYSANQLGSSVTLAGIPFTFGAANQVNVARATTIPLTAGKYSTLSVLGTAVNGTQQSQPFVVTYTDGTTATFTQSISDWYAPQHYPGEAVAIKTSYRDTSSGGRDARTFNVYGYSIPLNNTKTVKSFTLPNNNNVALLALTLSNPH